MTKQAKIDLPLSEAGHMSYLPLADLTLSPLNPRQGDLPDGDVESLADSIRLLGLIQNLSGYRAKRGKVEIVAGGRRLRALQHLAEQVPNHDAVQSIPVKVTEDAQLAQTWANAENSARADLDPADEIRAFGRMADTSIDAGTIASAFGVTEAHVKGRLKLAQLPHAVLDALKAKSINLDTAKAFTLCNDAKRMAEALSQIESGDIRDQQQLCRALMEQSVKQTDRRAIFVGQEVYEAAGGAITSDLFSEDVFFDAPALLDDLFAKKLEDEVAQLEAEGWKWITAIEDYYVPYGMIEDGKFGRIYEIAGELTDAEAEEFEALEELADGDALDETGQARMEELDTIMNGAYSAEQRALAGGIVYVNQRGELSYTLGLVKPEDKQAAYDAEILEKPYSYSGSSAPDNTPKSPYSKALAGDLDAIRLAATQTALLDKPDFVLDLLAFFLSPASGHWSGILGLRTDLQRNKPEKDDPAFTLHPRLGGPKPDDEDMEKADAEDDYLYRGIEDMGAEFAAFREKGKKTRNAQITQSIARMLHTQSDGAFMSSIEAEVGTNIRAIWTPTQDNFFGRMKGPYLIDLWCDLLDITTTSAEAKAFTKLKAKEKAERMANLFAHDPDVIKLFKVTKDQLVRIDAWVPDCMA